MVFFAGSIRVKSDEFNGDLLIPSTLAYAEKERKYAEKIGATYAKDPDLGHAFVKTSIDGFSSADGSESSLKVFFKVAFDGRKLPK